MKAKLGLVAAVWVLELGVLAPVVSANGAPGPAQPSHQHFFVHFSGLFVVDVDRSGGLSKGDETTFHDYLDQHGKRVGEEIGSCVIVDSATQPLANCSGTVRLPGGDISFQLLNSPPPVKVFSITGGIGHYQGADGQGKLVESGRGQFGTLDLYLTS